MHKRRIEIVKAPQFANLEGNPIRYRVPSSAQNASRVNPVMPGDFVVQCTAGSSDEVDGVSASDSTGTPARFFIGLVAQVFNLKGGLIDNNIILPEETGLVQVHDIRNLFRAGEDGVGGRIGENNQFGNCALIRSATVASFGETYNPDPAPGTMLDSSTVGGTTSNRAIGLKGFESDIQNMVPSYYTGPINETDPTGDGADISQDMVTVLRSFRFIINPSFRAPEFR